MDDDDESSLSEYNEGPSALNFESDDLQPYAKSDLAIPLRRSFSSIDYVKHTLQEYVEVVQLHSSDQPSESPFI